MNILVTGSNGQVGHCIYDIVNNNKNHYTDKNKYIFTSRSINNELSDIITLDISSPDLEKFIYDNDIDMIINCAAYTNVTAAEKEENYKDVLACNVTGVRKLGEIMDKRNGYLIHISSDYVYTGANNPINEEFPIYTPLSIYGRSKLVGDINAMNECENTIILRTSWVFSEYGNNFMIKIRKAIQDRMSNNELPLLEVTDNSIGTPTYAGMIASLIVDNIITCENYKNMRGVYNYSCEGCCSWYDYAKFIESIISPDTDIVKPKHVNDPIRPVYSVLDKDKIKKKLNIDIPNWMSMVKKILNK